MKDDRLEKGKKRRRLWMIQMEIKRKEAMAK